MPIFELSGDAIAAIPETTFGAEGVYERRDIQRMLRENINVLDDSLLVVAEEFGSWLDSSRRIDLLCVDTEANLVVVELKRTDDGGHMELQALRYAAMVSSMTFDQLVETHAQWKSPGQSDLEEARQAILDFLGWETADDEQFGRDVRIVLAAADFGKELTTTVLWLLERGLDIRCVRMKPYRQASGSVLVDIQQLIPLPEAASFQTQIGVKQRAARESRNVRRGLRYQWWETLLEQPNLDIHSDLKSSNSHYLVAREKRLNWSFLLWQAESGAELFIDMGRGEEEITLKIFDYLHQQRAEIERSFGDPLTWSRMDGSRGCKVTCRLSGGYRSPEDQWSTIQSAQISAMNRLRSVLLPLLATIPA